MFNLGQIRIEYGTMVFNIIAFLVLLLLVRRFAMKPAMKVMEDRQSYIESQLTTAEKAREEATKIADEQRQILAQAKKDAYELLENAKTQKEREAEEIIKAAQTRAEALIKEAAAEITREKDKALAELRSQVGDLSVLLASKIIEKELDSQTQTHLINDYLQQVGKQA